MRFQRTCRSMCTAAPHREATTPPGASWGTGSITSAIFPDPTWGLVCMSISTTRWRGGRRYWRSIILINYFYRKGNRKTRTPRRSQRERCRIRLGWSRPPGWRKQRPRHPSCSNVAGSCTAPAGFNTAGWSIACKYKSTFWSSDVVWLQNVFLMSRQRYLESLKLSI